MVTRHWNKPIKEPVDLHFADGDQIKKEENKDYTVYYIPYKQNLRDKLFTSNKNNHLNRFLRKLLTFYELIFQNYFLSVIPHKNHFDLIKQIIDENKSDLAGMIVTANPWVSFKIAYQINKVTGISWIADYRDDWTSRKIGHWYHSLGFIGKIFESLERASEVKFLSTAKCFTSVSEHYVNEIAKINKRKGNVIYNGYIKEEFDKEKSSDLFNDFTICYNGTLLDMQDLTILHEGLIKLNEKYSKTIKIKILFAGTGFDLEQKKRLENVFSDCIEFIAITPRMPRNEIIKIQQKSHLLLMIAYGKLKGVPSTKIFDYMATEKGVVVCPGDNDVIEKMLEETGQLILCNSVIEFTTKISFYIDQFIKEGKIQIPFNGSYANNYTRENQTKKLAELMDIYF